MRLRRPRVAPRISCPFCGNDFAPEDILFCDIMEHETIDMASYDSAYARFSENFIQLQTISVTSSDGKEIKIEMEKRNKYYFHPWSAQNRADKPPFHEPISCQYGNTHQLYPNRITVRRNDGLTPRMEMNAPDEPKPDAFSPQNEDSLADALTGGQFRMASAHLTDEDKPQLPGNPTFTLTTKACPHCHCFLPDDIGLYPLHRVVMLGSTRAGKTTYMTMAAHQITSGTGMPSGLMQCTISQESKRHFDYLTKCLKYDKLEATRFEGTNRPKVVFPLLFTVKPDNGSPFFLSIHDCPGEAMQSNAYLANFPALSTAESVIMVLDPYQFIQNVNDNGHCNVNFNDTVTIFQNNLPFFKKLRQIAFTLTKTDLIYGSEPDKYIHPNDYPYMDEMNLKDQHNGAVNLQWIANMSNQVSGAISKQLGYGHYENNIRLLTDQRNGLEATTLCCSTRSWNAAQDQGRFIPIIDESSGRRTYNMNGYRVLEPLLCILAKCNLLPVK